MTSCAADGSSHAVAVILPILSHPVLQLRWELLSSLGLGFGDPPLDAAGRLYPTPMLFIL
jgi:hypothetical protein